VGLSIALAFAQYVHATGDQDYLRERAWPILEGIADWITSRALKTDRGYEVKEVIGVAEQTDPVDNNAYVNMAAARVLLEAAGFARRLGRRDAERWENVAKRFYLPVDREGRFVKNHDRYAPEDDSPAAATPEALAGFFPINYRVDRELERSTIEFYLARANRFVGLPMLSSLLGVYAAWIGDRSAARRWFEQGYLDFIQEPFGEVNEFSRLKHPDKPRVGPFMANLGGFLMSCLYGLTGLELSAAEPADWFKRPVSLPEGWESIEVEQLYVRGKPVRLVAVHGQPKATLEPH